MCLSKPICKPVSVKLDVLDFEPIPGFMDKFLIRAYNDDGLGLLRAIELSRLQHYKLESNTEYSNARLKPSQHLKAGYNMAMLVEKPIFHFDDLHFVQKALDFHYPNTYNLMVFDHSARKSFVKKRLFTQEKMFVPIFVGNSEAEFALPILRYMLNGRIEYCGIRNVAKAFGVDRYCLNCKSTSRKCPCKKQKFFVF